MILSSHLPWLLNPHLPLDPHPLLDPGLLLDPGPLPDSDPGPLLDTIKRRTKVACSVNTLSEHTLLIHPNKENMTTIDILI